MQMTLTIRDVDDDTGCACDPIFTASGFFLVPRAGESIEVAMGADPDAVTEAFIVQSVSWLFVCTDDGPAQEALVLVKRKPDA